MCINSVYLRLHDDDGTRIGTLATYMPALPAAVIDLLARGDAGMFERMAGLIEPGRRQAAILFADLQAYAKDKVVFLISHLLYHFPQMRQVIFMDNGGAAVGTHEVLLASVPVYRQLYESQTGGQQHEA